MPSLWVKGNAAVSSTFDGQTYLFPGREQKAAFDASPAKYVPVLGSDCNVAYKKMGQRVAGDIRQAAIHNSRLYMFSNEMAKNEFLSNTETYANVDIALDGQCTVCKIEMQKDVAGKPEFATFYQGMRYYFPGADQQAMFNANPAKYAVSKHSSQQTGHAINGGAAKGSGSAAKGSDKKSRDLWAQNNPKSNSQIARISFEVLAEALRLRPICSSKKRMSVYYSGCIQISIAQIAGKFIHWFDRISIGDVPTVGGKNASRGDVYRELACKGVKVPNGFATTADAYRAFHSATALTPSIILMICSQVLRFWPVNPHTRLSMRLVANCRFLYGRDASMTAFHQALIAVHHPLHQYPIKNAHSDDRFGRCHFMRKWLLPSETVTTTDADSCWNCSWLATSWSRV